MIIKIEESLHNKLINKNKVRMLCVVGTRPEAIKMAPVINALKAESWVKVRVLVTAQHRKILDLVLDLFGIVPDIDLNVMKPNQTLPEITARMITELDRCFSDEAPDAVLAQGDTTTVMVTALAAFYHKIPFGHVEAGLRTGNRYNPFPEEMNRVIAGNLAKWHFAPTASSKNNLIAESIRDETIFVTGNTVIDALLDASSRCDAYKPDIPSNKRLVLVTAHRRENFGKPFDQICRAILTLVERNENVVALYPVHPNPNVRGTAYRLLGSHPQIILSDPLDYLPFIAAMKHAYLILSDSGGVQEEAPALGKPVLVLRNETERPEAVDEGVVKLVGTDPKTIIAETQKLLDDKETYQKMARGVSPYGDGNAASRIVSILKNSFNPCV
jgi:UDP-N-acetylglucosamine 2-epimerase (non-hydrolysing)